MLSQPPLHRSPHTWRPATKLSSIRSPSAVHRTNVLWSTQRCSFSVTNPDGLAFSVELHNVASDAEVYQVSLKKPLGLTLTDRNGGILVDEVIPNGHAAEAGVAVGDVLLATTAKAQVPSAAPGITETMLLQTAGQSFKTVTAALRSNTCAQCLVTLVLQRQSAGKQDAKLQQQQ